MANSNTFGVFVWTAENRYPASRALLTFKSEKSAQRAADRLNRTECSHVVRTIWAVTVNA